MIKNVEFKTSNNEVFQETNFVSLYDTMSEKIVKESEDFEGKDSGWTLDEILRLEVRTNRYSPFRALYPSANHPNKTSSYATHLNKLNFDGISFPTPLNEVKKFSKMNDIGINIYSFEEDLKIFPLLISDIVCEKHIDLLYIKNNDLGHYCFIKSLSRLVSKQLSKHQHKTYICKRCLSAFQTEYKLLQHNEMCGDKSPARVVMPSETCKFLKFKIFQHSLKIPFVVYADFECVTMKTDTCCPDPNFSFTNMYEKHVPIGFCYFISYQGGHYKDPVVYRGTDAPKCFIEKLEKDAIEIEHIYKNPKPLLPLTESEKQLYDNAKYCYFCDQTFRENNIKVRDHNHVTQKFNGPCCNSCNLAMKTPKFLPVFFHNLSGKICIHTYKLDLCWYFTTPALSWDAMLLNTKVAIELFTDYDMLLFIENGVRGGISQCCNRYAIANNKYMPNFNPDDESPWLKNYIDYNTKLRTKAVNDFQKDFYKLMNNSIFGKTMENVRRRVDIRLCSTEEQARKLIAKLNFNRRTIFSENLMAIHLKKTNNKFFKPIQVGMTILDLSKVLMYSFHYEYMKHRYDSKIKLMFTDTDSFIYEIKTDDFYSDMKDDLNLYDTSDYDKNNVYNLPLVNKKVIGKMKDVNKGNIMTEYVGLKSKIYAYKTNNKIEKRLKGIKKQTLKNKLMYSFSCMCWNFDFKEKKTRMRT
ncbi:uncharacterized protein NPIL_213411 [Nephila pilipes]|uniref:C2H2-type domain-containing protein n=1 Tax=Nephila pilipes TaxID=299642 RepID=A0A8X6Q6W8_NEPPI|nr:uncharacterized protein NPIL_213411 [Nephila pilipes]